MDAVRTDDFVQKEGGMSVAFRTWVGKREKKKKYRLKRKKKFKGIHSLKICEIIRNQL